MVIIKVFSLILIFFNLLILLTICKMHIKQKSIREGYFKIVFSQIILELLLNIIILLIVILSLFITNINSNLFFFISVLLNFFYNIDILYNTQTILYLMRAKNKVDSEDITTNTDDLSRTEEFRGSALSIDLKRYSFRRIHLISIFFSIIHSLIFFIIIFLQSNKEQNQELIWYFYFLDENKKNFLFLFIFILNYLYFALSICYCCIKQNINESIKLKHFSIYCFITSIIGLIFPSKIIINHFLKKDLKALLTYIYSFLFLFYLFVNMNFRLNCYYVQYILSRKGNKFCSKISFGIKILFSRIMVPSPNFIDFNNSFIYHSLSSEKDFYDVKDKKLKKGLDNSNNNNELNNSNSISLTDI